MTAPNVIFGTGAIGLATYEASDGAARPFDSSTVPATQVCLATSR